MARISRALRDLGASVSLEVSPSGGKLRLRATLPSPEGSWKQRRITTALPFPAGMDQARLLAEELGRDLELYKLGLEPFPFERWSQPLSEISRGGRRRCEWTNSPQQDRNMVETAAQARTERRCLLADRLRDTTQAVTC
jgi:hypothetical protein